MIVKYKNKEYVLRRDGNYRPVTYVTRKGLEYIRKMLSKERNLSSI